MAQELSHPSNFFNRELSWIDFNSRVLEEAQDPKNPLLERLKFLSIFSSNLDEFFMVRVAGLLHQAAEGVSVHEAPDGRGAEEVLKEIDRSLHRLVAAQYDCFNREILPGLKAHGILLVDLENAGPAEQASIEKLFRSEVFPVLSPMAVDPAHPFPHVQNRTLNLAVMLESKGRSALKIRNPKQCFAIVPVPLIPERLVPVSSGEGQDSFVLIESIVREHVAEIFSGFRVIECVPFRVTRDSDIIIDDQEETGDLVKLIEEKLRKRKRGAAVRLEISASASDEIVSMLRASLELDEENVFRVHGPLNLSAFMRWVSLKGYAALKDPPYLGQIARALSRGKGTLFERIRQGDILLHHPYETFNTVVDWLEEAANDPNVLAIKQTLYRAGGSNPIIDSLARAAENDKQVNVLVELKARFDEENNLIWARRLERAGAHVVYGLVGLKTHCKVVVVVRRDADRIRRYVHLSTGNYNPTTARLYTDLGLLTCDEKIGEDATNLFNMLTGFSQAPKWNKLLVAPLGMREKIVDLIEREIHHQQGGREGRIVAKMNSLVDGELITALYRASRARVAVDLIVRGICCLRPGVPGLSETIRVHSIVGRFLEHSRIFYFHNAGQPEVFLGSADWMPRNFVRRVETLYPVEDPTIRDRLIHEVLGTCLRDNVKARELGPDGIYRRVPRADGVEEVCAQQVFMDLATGVLSPSNLPGLPPALRVVSSHAAPARAEA
jgi:polyphosphate kinase